MKALILADVHLTEKLPKAYKTAKKFIKTKHFDKIIILGDFVDVCALSHWNKDKKRTMENKRYLTEIELANKELDFLQKHCKEIVYIEGNHENFVERYLETHPELIGVVDLKSQLQIQERNIKWVSLNKLYKLGNYYFTHGMYHSKYHAQKHLLTFGCNIIYGHLHRPQHDTLNLAKSPDAVAWCMPCLSDHNPAYLKGKPSKWTNGFGIYEYKEGIGQYTPVYFHNNKFMYEGKVWK